MFGQTDTPADQFSKFWSDAMSRMAGAGVPNPFQSTNDDVMKQMRRAFFDSWAKSCEEFMGSEAFLVSMKKSMDDGLVFKQQINEFMTKALHGASMPSRQDMDSILQALKSMESRVLESVEEVTRRVIEIEKRVAAVESTKGRSGAKKSSASKKGTAE